MRLIDLREHLKLRRSNRSYSTASLNRFINEAYLDIASRRNWGWLRRVYRYDTTAAATVDVSCTAGNSLLMPAGGTIKTSWGRRVLVDGRVYRVINVNEAGTLWQTDHPVHLTSAATPATILYDEIALPRSTDTVIGAKLITGSNPLSLDGIEPWIFQERSRSSKGQPSDYSTIRKEPIPPPTPTLPAPTFSGAPGTGPEAGTYTYWFSHIDKQSGAESALSPPLEVTNTSGNTANFIITARNDFLWRIYRSRKHVTGEDPQPYLLATATTSPASYGDVVKDDYLGPQAPGSASSLFMTLYPAPGASYEIEVIYQAQVADLGEDQHRPLFDESYHTVILDGAEALMLEASDEFRAAQAARQRFEVAIARMVQRDRLSQGTLTPIAARRGMNRIRAGRTAERWEYP